jgi:hypothetical protein
MRASHYKLVALVLALQCILILATNWCIEAHWDFLSTALATLGAILTWAGYIYIFYNLPTFARMPSIPKMICLTFTAIVAGAGGYFVILIFLSFFGINLMD